MNNSERLSVNDIPGKSNFEGKKISPDAMVIGREGVRDQGESISDPETKNEKIDKLNKDWQQALEIVGTNRESKLIKTGKKALVIAGLATGLVAAVIRGGEKPIKLPELKKDAWEEKMRHDLVEYSNDQISLDYSEEGGFVRVTVKAGRGEDEYNLNDPDKDGLIESGDAHNTGNGKGSVLLNADEGNGGGLGLAPQAAIIQLKDKLRAEE